jgi:hypothetical protein
LLFAASISSPAHAHVSLDYPKSRYYVNNLADQNKLKNGPCGASNDSRTTNGSLVTTLKPGDKITVRWRETVQHPGFFRIAFDSDGQNFTLPGSASNGDGVTILAEKIPDKSGANNLEYTYEVTLPNIECTKCTLQLVQVMTTSPPPYEEGPGNDLYFNCADVVLKADGTSSGGGTGGANAGGMSNGGRGGALGAGSGGTAGSSANGGTSTGGSGGFVNGGAGGTNQAGAGFAGTNQGGTMGGQASGGGSSGQSGSSSSGGSNALGGASAQSGGSAQGGAGTQGGANAAGMNGGLGVSNGGSPSMPTPSDDSTGCSCRIGVPRGARGGVTLAGLMLAALYRQRARRRATRRPASR